MTKKEGIFLLIAVVLALFLAVFIGIATHHMKRADEQENLVSSLNASLEVWRDRDSINHAKIEVIETARIKDFLAIQSKDAEVKKLQEVVKQYEKQLGERGSVTNVTTSTEISVSSTVKIDTIAGNCSFEFVEGDEWVSTKVVVEGTSNSDDLEVMLDYKIKNEYSVIIGEEGGNIFKQGKPFVEVINHNPYTETYQLRTYQVSGYKKPKQWSVGLGAALGLSGVYHNKQVIAGPGFTVGFVIGWTPIRF